MPGINILRHIVQVQEPTVLQDSFTGAPMNSSFSTIATIPCRVIDPSSTWRLLYAQKDMIITHHVYTYKTNVYIMPGYQLLWNDRRSQGRAGSFQTFTRTLRVIGAILLGGKREAQRIDCQEILNACQSVTNTLN